MEETATIGTEEQGQDPLGILGGDKKQQPKASADPLGILGVKKKEDTSKTSAVSPSASSDAPTQTVTPDILSGSNIPSLHEQIFGSKPKSDQPEYLRQQQQKNIALSQPADQAKKRQKDESSFLKNPSVKDISTDDKSLLSKEEKTLAIGKSDAEKQVLHERVNKFRDNYFNADVKPEDIDLVHGGLEGLTAQQAADAINVKLKKIKESGDAPLKKSTANYISELGKINGKIDELQQSLAPGPVPVNNPDQVRADLAQLQEQKAFMQRSLNQVYDVKATKAANDIFHQLQGKFDGSSWDEIFENPDKHYPLIDLSHGNSPIQWDPKSKTITKESQEWVRRQTDQQLNDHPDDIINANTSGDINSKNRNYPDIAQKVIDRLNLEVPIANAQKKTKEAFVKEHPEISALIDHQDRINKELSPAKLASAEAYTNTYMDKEFLNIKNRYWGEGGIILGNPDFVKAQHKYAEAVANKTMTEDVAKKQIEAEVQNNPALKKLYDNQQKEVESVRDKGRQMWSDYLTNVISASNPNTVINKDGTLGIKGLTKTESKKLLNEYNDTLAKATAEALHGQHKELGLQADARAKRLGSFFGTLTESANDIGASFSKIIFDKTGWGGDNVRAFQAQKDAEIPVSQSDESKKWQYKGIMSLIDPNFYLSKIGSQLPIFAGAGAVGLLTEGEGIPEYISYLSSAGILAATNAVSTYNDIASGNQRDVNGNKLTELDAANAAANNFSENALPDALFMAVNMGILSRAKSIVKPSIGREILSSTKNALVGAIPIAWQGYNGYADELRAQGKTPDIWDYAQDGSFAKSLIDGIIGGGIIGLLHLPTNYSKQTENWKRLIINSDGELKSNSLYNVSLQHEMNGNGNTQRDQMKIKLATDNWKGRESEKAEMEQALQYSTALKRNIDGAGIDVTDINGAYQAHNLALADLHDMWAEQNKDNKNLSSIYSDQAKDFREAARNVMEGKAKYYYLQDTSDKPIFISDDAFKTMDASGKLKDLMEKGIIKTVIKSDDPEFANAYKEAQIKKFSIKHPINPVLEEKDTEKIIKAISGNIDELSEAGKMQIGIHVDNPDSHEELAKMIVSQGAEHPNILRDMIGNDAFKVIEPIIEKQKDIYSQSKIKNNDEENANGDKGQESNRLENEDEGRGKGSERQEGKEGDVAVKGAADNDAAPSLYKKNIRDDYFAKSDFFSDEEKEKFQKLDESGQDKMIDDKRDKLSNIENETENKNVPTGQDKSDADNIKTYGKEKTISQRVAEIPEGTIVNPYDKVLNYFSGEGKVHSSALQELFGDKNGKSVENERRARIGLLGKDAPSVDDLAHRLWEEDTTGKYTTEDYKDAIENVLRDHNSKSTMSKDLAERYDVDTAYEKYRQEHGRIFSDIYDNLSDDDINHILSLDSEGREKDIAEYLDSLNTNVNEQPNEPAKEPTGNDKKDVSDTDKEKGSAAPPPQKPPEKIGEPSTSPEKEWTAVRKQKLAEIDGVKEMFDKRGETTWQQTYESALSNVQDMYPEKNLYDALHARVDHFSGMLDRGTLFNPTSEDNAAFNILRNLTDSKISDIAGWDSDDPVIREAALDEFKGYQKTLFDIARVTNPEGEAGRAFNILQSETRIDPDAGLKIRRIELLDAKGGDKLSDEDLKWTSEQWEEEKKHLQKISDAREADLKKSFDAQIQKLTKEFQDKLKNKKVSKSDETKQKKENLLKQSGKDFADKLRSGKLKGTYATIPGFPQAVNLTIEAIAQIVEKGATLAQAISDYVKSNNIKDEDRFTSDFLGVLSNMEKKGDYLEKIKTIADADKVSSVTDKMVAANFIRDYVNSHIGLHDAKDILDAAHEELKEVLPDLTKEKLIEAYLKENEFKQSTSKKLKTWQAESKASLKNIAKLEEDIEDLNNLKKVRQRNFPTEREKIDYEKKLSDEKENLLKKLRESESALRKTDRDADRKTARLAELNSDIQRMKERGELLKKSRSKNEKQIDADIEGKQYALKKAMTDKGIKSSSEDKFTKATYDQRAKSHNERLSDIGKQIDAKLADENLPDNEKKELVKLKNQLDAAGIKLDENSRLSQKKVLDEGKYILNNIKNGFKGDEAIKRDLQKASDKFDSDKDESDQNIKLERTKQQYIRDIEESQRKLNAGEFEDEQPVVLKKSDAELVQLEAYKRFFRDAYEKKKREYQRGKTPTVRKLADFGRMAQVVFLIRKFSTFANVTASAAIKPQLNAASKLTTGRFFDTLPFETTRAISERAKLGGESNSIETIKRSEQAVFRQAGEAKLKSIAEKANAVYEKSDHEYQIAKGELENIEDKRTKEYKDKAAEVEKLKNENNKNLVSAIGNSIYQFIGGSSVGEAYDVLLHRAAKIDEVFGQFDKEGLTKYNKDGTSSEKINAALDNVTYVANFVTRSHAALKNFSSRSEFAAGFTARLEGAVADGVDISKPEKILEIANESYLDWERGKYGESNWVSDKWNEITKAVDKISPEAALLMKADVAITRVPVNMAKEAILEYTLGGIIGSYKAWKAYNEARGNTLNLGYTDEKAAEFKTELKNQLRQLDPKEAATIARAFRKGGFGMGLFALAAIGGVTFGGYPHLGQSKEDKEKRAREKETGKPEIKTQEIKIGGYTLPLWASKIVEHTPAFAPTLNALNLNEVYHNSVKAGQTTPQAAKSAIMSNVEHLAFSIPQIQNFVMPLAKPLVDRYTSPWTWDDVDKAGNPIKRTALEAKDYKAILPWGDKKEVLSDLYYKEALNVQKSYKRAISEVENNANLNDQQKDEEVKRLREQQQKSIDLIYENNKKNPQ